VEHEDVMDKAAPDPLLAIRTRIDAIDAEMHRLLVDRSAVIDELIHVKGTSKPGAAFRPEREADMMRRLVMRHSGNLPLTTVEHIWREIITTFTAMQAPFGIAAAPSADPLALRDAIRFYFGFSIAVSEAASGEAAVARVAETRKDIAVLDAATSGRWWGGLCGAQAPKIFAKLPFIECPERPADLPAYVVGPPLRDTALPDIRIYAAKAGPAVDTAVAGWGGRLAARDGDEVLLELPVAVQPEDLARDEGSDFKLVGGFAQPIRLLAERVS
jgi:chorismate mutase/prephenate dehydratase